MEGLIKVIVFIYFGLFQSELKISFIFKDFQLGAFFNG